MEDEINYDIDEGVIKYSCNPEKTSVKQEDVYKIYTDSSNFTFF